MSQAVIYPSKFKNLAKIKAHIEKIIKEGKVFGRNAKMTMKGQPGFSTSGWYKIDKEKIIMIIKSEDAEKGIFGSEEAGEVLYRGQEGFAILYDPENKESPISIAVETEYKEADDPKVNRLRKLIEKHIDSPIKKQALRDKLQAAGIRIVDKPDGGWIAEGEIPAEMLAGIKGIKATGGD